jgi:hypothetical protein
MLRLVPTLAGLALALHLGCGGGEERPREEGGSEEASPAAGGATGPPPGPRPQKAWRSATLAGGPAGWT